MHGTLVRVEVEHLPGNRDPKPQPHQRTDRWWQSFLRRFDVEHAFRFMKQTLGLTGDDRRHGPAILLAMAPLR